MPSVMKLASTAGSAEFTSPMSSISSVVPPSPMSSTRPPTQSPWSSSGSSPYSAERSMNSRICRFSFEPTSPSSLTSVTMNGSRFVSPIE